MVRPENATEYFRWQDHTPRGRWTYSALQKIRSPTRESVWDQSRHWYRERLPVANSRRIRCPAREYSGPKSPKMLQARSRLNRLLPPGARSQLWAAGRDAVVGLLHSPAPNRCLPNSKAQEAIG